METLKQPARHYRRIRIGDGAYEHAFKNPPIPDQQQQIVSEPQKQLNSSAKPPHQTDNIQATKPLLMPPQPVRYLKPPKYDYF